MRLTLLLIPEDTGFVTDGGIPGVALPETGTPLSVLSLQRATGHPNGHFGL
jgi:hypothetical protein